MLKLIQYFAITLLGSLFCSLSVAGQWQYSEEKDVMRDTVIKTASLVSSDDSPAAKFGLSATLRIIDQPEGNSGAVVAIDGGSISCDSVCKVLMKFDDGDIKEVMVAAKTGDKDFAPWDQAAVVGAAGYADKLIIEARLVKKGAQQFIFDLSDMPIDIEWLPSKPPLKYKYGTIRKEIEDIAGLAEKINPNKNCLNLTNAGSIVMEGIDLPGTVCFVNNRLYLVILDISKANKNAISKIYSHLDDVYGKGDVVVDGYIRWPESPGGMDQYMSSASSFLGRQIMFTDDRLQMLSAHKK